MLGFVTQIQTRTYSPPKPRKKNMEPLVPALFAGFGIALLVVAYLINRYKRLSFRVIVIFTAGIGALSLASAVSVIISEFVFVGPVILTLLTTCLWYKSGKSIADTIFHKLMQTFNATSQKFVRTFNRTFRGYDRTRRHGVVPPH